MRETEAVERARHEIEVCNACRYCEGFCAVFPAMTRRLAFEPVDVHFLANLCHNCGACLHACQYAPPHEFAVNVPQALATTRVRTYQAYAWPAAFGALYRRSGLTTATALALGLTLMLCIGSAASGSLLRSVPGGNFYAVVPHHVMASLFAAVFLFAIGSLAVGVTRYWRDLGAGDLRAPAASAVALLLETTSVPPFVSAP